MFVQIPLICETGLRLMPEPAIRVEPRKIDYTGNGDSTNTFNVNQ